LVLHTWIPGDFPDSVITYDSDNIKRTMKVVKGNKTLSEICDSLCAKHNVTGSKRNRVRADYGL